MQDSPNPESFASGGCSTDSDLNVQGPPSPNSAGWQPVPPRLPSCIFHSQIRGGVCQGTTREDSGMLWLRKKIEADKPDPRPCWAAPSPNWDSQAPTKSSHKMPSPLFPSQSGFETISLRGFLSPHQSHSYCTSAWGLDRSHSAMLLPPKYFLALLHCFAVVFPRAPNYTKTIH